MFEVRRFGDALQLGILHDQIRHKGFVQSDIDVSVDGGGDEEAGVLLIIRRQIRAASAEADPQW